MEKLIIVFVVLAIIVLFLTAILLIISLFSKIDFGILFEDKSEVLQTTPTNKQSEEEMELKERRNWKPNKDMLYVPSPNPARLQKDNEEIKSVEF